MVTLETLETLDAIGAIGAAARGGREAWIRPHFGHTLLVTADWGLLTSGDWADALVATMDGTNNRARKTNAIRKRTGKFADERTFYSPSGRNRASKRAAEAEQ